MSSDNRIVALVTGGGSGIGAALCRRLAGPERIIFVHTGSKRANAESVCRELEARGAEAHALVADFSHEPASAAGLIQEVKQRCGRLDQLVHLAGYADRRKFGELDAEGFDKALSTHLRAFFHLATAAVEPLRRSACGRVVTAGSFVAHAFRFEPEFLFPGSAAARGGVAAVTKALAAQLARDNVTVNCVVPGFIRKAAAAHTSLNEGLAKRVSELVPLGRFGEPDEVAAVIAFLLSRDGGYITGQCIHVDGGVTL